MMDGAGAAGARRGRAEPLTLSVVTPSRNQGRFIEGTIRSILDQAGDFALDYIVVDGGSTDSSVDIIRRHARLVEERQSARRCVRATLRWVSEPDGGQGDAVNKGYRLAVGDVLGWVNSDDRLLPGALEIVAAEFRSAPRLGLVWGNGRIEDEQGACLFERRPARFSLRRFLKGGEGLPQPSVFVSRRAWETAGPLDTRLYYTLDQDWYLRIAARHPIRHVDAMLSAAVRHASAKTFDARAPDYCAERILLLARYGGSRAFVRGFAGAAAHGIGGGLESVDAYLADLRAAVERRADLIGRPLGPRLWRRAIARSYAMLALFNARRDRRQSLRLLRRAAATDAAAIGSADWLRAAAKLALGGCG